MIEFATLFTERLKQAEIPYMITGSVASMFYGMPRYTNDVDIIISLPMKKVDKLATAFPSDQFYCPPAESVILEIARPQRGHFNIIHHETGFRADIYLLGADPLHRWGIQNRRVFNLDNVELALAPPEYVIIRKLEYFREGKSEKHILDIRNMLDTSMDHIDQKLLGDLIADLKLNDEWLLVNDR